MAQVVLKDETIEKIEKITGKKFTRGADCLINEVITILQRGEQNDNR